MTIVQHDGLTTFLKEQATEGLRHEGDLQDTRTFPQAPAQPESKSRSNSSLAGPAPESSDRSSSELKDPEDSYDHKLFPNPRPGLPRALFCPSPTGGFKRARTSEPDASWNSEKQLVEVPLSGKGKREKKRAGSKRVTTPAAIPEKKKRRLERNRVSARESRKKKKVYIQSLERQVLFLSSLQICLLKSDLKRCQQKLEEYATGDKLTLTNSQDLAMHVDMEMQQMVDMVILAHTHGETEAIDAAVHSLRIRYGIGSEERRRAINALFKRLVDYIIPPCYAHLMWTAKEGCGFFDVSNLTANTEGGENIEESKEIAECAQRDQTEFLEIFNSRTTLQGFTAELASKVKLFLAAKQDLCNEMDKFGLYVNQHILDKVSSQTVAAFLRWSDTVRACSQGVDKTADFYDVHLFARPAA